MHSPTPLFKKERNCFDPALGTPYDVFGDIQIALKRLNRNPVAPQSLGWSGGLAARREALLTVSRRTFCPGPADR